MLILEGRCPRCKGNLILEEGPKAITCESCGSSSKASKEILVRLLIHCGLLPITNASLNQLWIKLKVNSVEYGPKDLRQTLTPAGKIIFRSYQEGEEVRGDGLLGLVKATRGLINDEIILGDLRKGGFIL